MADIATETRVPVQIGPANAAIPVPPGRMTTADRYFDIELPLRKAIDYAIKQQFPGYEVIKVEYGKLRWRYKYPFSFRDTPGDDMKRLIQAAKDGGMRWAYLKSSVWAYPPAEDVAEDVEA